MKEQKQNGEFINNIAVSIKKKALTLIYMDERHINYAQKLNISFIATRQKIAICLS